MVLDGGGDDVPALPSPGLGHAPEGPVIGLSAAGGEEDLVWLGAQARGHLRPGGVQIGLGRLSEAVEA